MNLYKFLVPLFASLFLCSYLCSVPLYFPLLIPLSLSLSGPNKHTITQVKDALHDGLRAVKNAIEDKSVVPGGGAFEVAVHAALTSAEFLNTVPGREKFGVRVSERGTTISQ